MFVVFKTSPDAAPEVKRVSDSLTPSQIENALNLRVNWFGSRASTPEAAIKEALDSGFKYRSAREMDKLRMPAISLGDQAARYVKDLGK